MMKNLFLIFLLSWTMAIHAQEPLKLKVELEEFNSTEKVYNFISENLVGIVGWQFRMEFDGTKMKFKEIRNPIQEAMGSGNFNEPVPGELRSVWLDTDLEADNYPDSTVLFRLVFEILDTEGAPLCFLESQEYFEFIVDEGSGSFTLAEILISDDCYQGFSIILDPTATAAPDEPEVEPIADLNLTTSGQLSFTAFQEQDVHLSLMDMSGKVITTIDPRRYTQGRNTVQCRSVVPGVYLVKAIAGDGEGSVFKVFAY